MATAAFLRFRDPVMVESLKAQAHGGMDIGGVLIGMHLRPVAVPLRLSVRKIGEAVLLAAKTRPKLVGGDAQEAGRISSKTSLNMPATPRAS